MALVENFALFFADFGVPATLNGVAVQSIFDDANALGTVGPFGMASNAPMIALATADVPANPVGLPVIANGVSYLVSAHEPDGTGISRLVLEVV